MNLFNYCNKFCLKVLAPLTLLSAFFLILYAGYLLSYPFKTIELLNEPMPVTPNIIPRGSSNYKVFVHYIKYRDADIHTARHIECEGGELVNLTPVERSFPLGENELYMNNTAIPEHTPLGKCKLVYTVNYQINPIRQITQIFNTEWFEVIE